MKKKLIVVLSVLIALAVTVTAVTAQPTTKQGATAAATSVLQETQTAIPTLVPFEDTTPTENYNVSKRIAVALNGEIYLTPCENGLIQGVKPVDKILANVEGTYCYNWEYMDLDNGSLPVDVSESWRISVRMDEQGKVAYSLMTADYGETDGLTHEQFITEGEFLMLVDMGLPINQ